MQSIDRILKTQNEIFNVEHTILKIQQNLGDNQCFNLLKEEDLLKQHLKSPKEELSVPSTAHSPDALQTAGKSNEDLAQNDVLFCQPEKGIEEQIQVPQEPQMKKYSFDTNKDSYVQIPSDYSTDDEFFKKAIDHLNAPANSWEKITTEKGIDVYKNTDPTVKPIMVRFFTTVNYSKETLFQAMENRELKKKWDADAPKVDIVESNPAEHYEVLHMVAKTKIPFVSDRECVFVKSVITDFPNENSFFVYCRSIDHPNYPLNKKNVRAKIVLAGYYFEQIAENKSKVAMVNQFDPDINEMMMNKMAPKSALGWIEKILVGCKYIEANKK